MKTKTIPFDLETAKKIQAGEVEGRLITSEGYAVHIFYFGLMPCNRCIGFVEEKRFEEYRWDTVVEIYPNGMAACTCVCENDRNGFACSKHFVVLIELPEEAPKHEFKPFDKVLFRFDSKSEWKPYLYSMPFGDGHLVIGSNLVGYCIPYEGNENLVGTTYKPKED